MIGSGTAFEVTLKGKVTVLHTFCSEENCADSGGPSAVIQAPNGNLYGTTLYGGSGEASECNSYSTGCGTVYELTPSGKFTTLYDFCSQANCTDGAVPYVGLIQGTNGNFYGTTSAGGIVDEAVCAAHAARFSRLQTAAC